MNIYLANNIMKSSAGNTVYGEITYVMSSQYMRNKTFWIPYDSGACVTGDPKSLPVGTPEHWYTHRIVARN